MISGGIGITPFISMLRDIDHKKTQADIVLIFSNRNSQSTAYLEELKSYEKSIPGFRLVLIMNADPNWNGEKRIVDENLIKEYIIDYQERTFMIVGPPPMVKAMQDVCKKINITSTIIENFAGY